MVHCAGPLSWPTPIGFHYGVRYSRDFIEYGQLSAVFIVKPKHGSSYLFSPFLVNFKVLLYCGQGTVSRNLFPVP